MTAAPSIFHQLNYFQQIIQVRVQLQFIPAPKSSHKILGGFLKDSWGILGGSLRDPGGIQPIRHSTKLQETPLTVSKQKGADAGIRILRDSQGFSGIF